MSVKYSNNASTTLSAGISSSDTTINIASASKFPTLSVGDYYYGTLANTNNTKIEVVKITAATSTTLTAVRGLDDTTAQAFDSGDNFQIRVTAGTLESATSTDVSITGGSISTSTITDATASAKGLATAAQITKLDAIEALADVTDTTNVTAAGALMDSELAGIDAVKATTGTFLIADQAKLDGIETNATNYAHPSHPGDDFSVDTGALTGAIVVSDIDINVTTDTSGHVTDANGVVSTRTLTLADLGYTPPASFPSGTKMVFAQAAAPTGWTQDTTNNDKALRVVSGSGGGTGGTHAFSSPPSTAHTHSFSDSSSTTSSAGGHSHTGPSHTHTGPSHTHSTPNHTHSHTLSAGAHTLTESQMPSHRHQVDRRAYTYGGSDGVAGTDGNYNLGDSWNIIKYTGGSSSHSHSLSGSISSGGGGTSGAGGTGATGSSGTGSTSTAAAHTHTVAVSGTSGSAGPTAFAPQYVDVIVCSKD